MSELFLDLETYSDVSIKSGTYRYAEGAEIMLFAYAIDDGPVQVWQCQYEKPPEDLFYELYGDCPLIAHNAFFDRTMLTQVGRAAGVSITEAQQEGSALLGGMIDLSPERWRCVMAQALAHSLPGKLELLGSVLGLTEDEQKNKEGKALIRLFCSPRPKNMKLRRATRETHPEEWARFVEYARQDVATMRTIYRKLPTWNYTGRELALWHLDQACNDRGFAVDLGLAHAAIRASERAQANLAERTQEITKYDPETGEGVAAATQRDKLLQYVLEAHGVSLPDMKADTLERRLDDPELPEAVKELLRVRLSSSKTSASKYKRLVQCTSSDGRLRGALQFCGASRTGRWAGRLFQPQNLPRPYMEAEDIEAGIEAMKADAEDLLFDDVMGLCGNAVRGSIIAAPGKKLVVSDLKNIEGRMMAWIAGEEWKVQAFRDFDAGIGKDSYILEYAKSFNVDPDVVTKPERQIGKVISLQNQFEGGVGAGVTAAATYGMDLEKLTEQAWPILDTELIDEARDFLEWLYKKATKSGRGDPDERKLKARYGLPEKTFLVLDSLKRAWRRGHPKTKQLWADLKNGMRATIENGGSRQVGKLVFDRQKAWVRIRLPSGRYLSYPSPRVEDDTLTYMGISQYTRKWCRLKTFGGKLSENVISATSRDILAYNMPAVEAAGYRLVLSVHDELVTEAPDSPEFNDEHLSSLIAANPPWAEGLPLAAAGFTAYRYKKAD